MGGASLRTCVRLGSSPLEALARVTDLLAGASAGDLPVDRESLAALRRCIDRLEAVFVAALVRFEDAGGHRADGATSATAWARESLRMNGGAARERLRAGRVLAEQLPAVGAAFAAGEVSLAHVAAITAVVEADPARAAQLAAAEPELLQVARSVEPRRMRQVIEGWALDADPDADRRTAMLLFSHRTLLVAAGPGGAVDVLGQLDPVGGAAVITALDAVATALRSPKDERTAAQLRADALVALATGALAFGEHAPGARIPDSGGLRPQVVVTIPLSAVRERLGAAELERVGRISADTALRIMCDAAVQPALIDDTTGQPLDLGRNRRDPDPRLRRAVLLRDRRLPLRRLRPPLGLVRGPPPACPGRKAAGPTVRTWWSYAHGTITTSTKAGSGSSNAPAAGSEPSDPTAARSTRRSRPGIYEGRQRWH